jgi:hypothetical protein
MLRIPDRSAVLMAIHIHWKIASITRKRNTADRLVGLVVGEWPDQCRCRPQMRGAEMPLEDAWNVVRRDAACRGCRLVRTLLSGA